MSLSDWAKRYLLSLNFRSIWSSSLNNIFLPVIFISLSSLTVVKICLLVFFSISSWLRYSIIIFLLFCISKELVYSFIILVETSFWIIIGILRGLNGSILWVLFLSINLGQIVFFANGTAVWKATGLYGTLLNILGNSFSRLTGALLYDSMPFKGSFSMNFGYTSALDIGAIE